MNNHPDIHRYADAARATELRARAADWRLARTAAVATATRGGGPARTRLGWLLIEVGLRLVRPPAPARPVRG